jgi:tetratricopeptide (TPR) repeat protein
MGNGLILNSRFQCKKQLKLNFILLIFPIALIGCTPKPITLNPTIPTSSADDSSNKANQRIALCAFIDDRGVYLQSGAGGQPFSSSKDLGIGGTVKNTTVDQAVTDGVRAVFEVAGFTVENVYSSTGIGGIGYPVISGKVIGFAGFYTPRWEVVGGSCVYRVVFELTVNFPGVSEPYFQTYAGESAAVSAMVMTIPLRTPEQAANEALRKALEEMARDKVLFDKLWHPGFSESLEKTTSDVTDASERIELKADDAVRYVKRGNVYYNSEQYEKAISEYNKAIELDSGFAIAYYNRGHAYALLQRYEQARKDLLKALELNPAIKPNVKELSDIYKLGLKLD